MANRLVSVNDDFDFPKAVADRQAERLGDATTAEGKAIASAVGPVQEAVAEVRAGVTTSPPLAVRQLAEIGTSGTRITAVEPGRQFIILRAADVDISVAQAWPDSTTDPGTGYETVTAGTEILLTGSAPVWAKAAVATTATIYKEVRI